MTQEDAKATRPAQARTSGGIANRPLVYGSICSGIEAATVAWHALGWKPAFFSEIDNFPRAVLQHRYPEVPLHGDFATIRKDDYAAIDLLVGGTPCQSFSVSGLRRGLADQRGNLALEFVRLAERLGPRWVVWENVPGVLSSDQGRAFGTFLGALAECGYGFAYRVLDAQHFGVPQRRRRVFVVGRLGDWRPPAAVLFERESLLGDLTPGRRARQSPATGPGARPGGGGGIGTDPDAGLIARTAPCLRSGNVYNNSDPGMEARMLVAHSPRADGFDASEDGTGCGTPLVPVAFHPTQDPINHTDGTTHSMGCGSKGGAATIAVAFAQNTRDEVRLIGGDGRVVGALAAEPGMKRQSYVGCFKAGQGKKARSIGYDERLAPTLSSADNGNNRTPALITGMQVRRLTPRECERLQGFPDDFTLVPYRGKVAADGPRYKALGNSMAVPVMRWLGERIQHVEDLLSEFAP